MRHAAKEGERTHMALEEALHPRRGEQHYEGGGRVAESHVKHVDHRRLAAQEDKGFAPVHLGRLREMQEGLSFRRELTPTGGHIQATGARSTRLPRAVLVPEALRDASGGVALLGQSVLVGKEPRVDDGLTKRGCFTRAGFRNGCRGLAPKEC
jgi:hypothetical protein